MPDDNRLPATGNEHSLNRNRDAGLARYEAFTVAELPLSLQIFFNPELNERCKDVARYLARAEGFTPKHLIGKVEACFAVVSRALTWRLDPYAVADATYQTPNGKVGYLGTLCQAIIENSGRLAGGVKFEHYGDWSRVQGKFRLQKSAKGNEYPVANWKPEAEAGLGVTVRAQLLNEDEPRSMDFDMIQAFPRYSTLWATDPRTQIKYTAVRRFGTSVVPTLFMGIPFDREDFSEFAATLKDITPDRPELAEFANTGSRRPRKRREAEALWGGDGDSGDATTKIAPDEPRELSPQATEQTDSEFDDGDDTPTITIFSFVDEVGELHENADPEILTDLYLEKLEAAANVATREAIWENGVGLLAALRRIGLDPIADAIEQHYAALIKAAEQQTEQQEAEREPVKFADVPTDLLIPYNAAKPGEWFQPAGAKLREMMAQNRPPADFTKFRDVNKATLDVLRGGYSFWSSELEKRIVAGEQRQLRDAGL